MFAVLLIRKISFLCGLFYVSGLAIAGTAQQHPAPGKTFSPMLKYAAFASAAYGSVDTFKRICQTYGWEFTDTGANITDKVRYFVAVKDSDKSQLIAIRGTSNAENAIIDIDYELTPDEILGIELHKGFAQSSQNIYQQLKKQLRKDYTIHITGHSLGGAVAVILAMYLDKQGYTVGDVITFGQPKVTNRSGAKTFQHLHVVRINTALDMVPLVPPFDASQILSWKFDVFWHIGKEYVLLSDKYYSELDGLDSLLRGADFLVKKPTVDNIAAHKIVTYIELLKNLANQGIQIPYDRRDEYITPQPSPAATTSAQHT